MTAPFDGRLIDKSIRRVNRKIYRYVAGFVVLTFAGMSIAIAAFVLAALCALGLLVVNLFRPTPARPIALERSPRDQTDTIGTATDLLSGRLLRIAVHGEAQRNSDGSSRQDVIAKLKEGEYVALHAEPSNRYDKNAVRVDSALGTIGYIPAGECERIGHLLHNGHPKKCYIAEIAGDGRNYNFGVWLNVEF